MVYFTLTTQQYMYWHVLASHAIVNHFPNFFGLTHAVMSNNILNWSRWPIAGCLPFELTNWRQLSRAGTGRGKDQVGQKWPSHKWDNLFQTNFSLFYHFPLQIFSNRRPVWPRKIGSPRLAGKSISFEIIQGTVTKQTEKTRWRTNSAVSVLLFFLDMQQSWDKTNGEYYWKRS